MSIQTHTPKRRPILKAMGLLGLAFCVVGLLVAARPAAQDTDAATCAECHDEIAKAFASTPHAQNCTACHRDAGLHVEEQGPIFAFKDSDTANAKTEVCLSCHSKDNPRYMAGPHGKASLDCTVCHSVHAEKPMPSLLRTSAEKNCAVCHEDVMAKFRLNERHRLQEGILECSTCHDPHEPSVRERLGGFKHQSCLECHTDKGGPFLYEHGSSSVEGCSACHDVHGSPNRHMLKNQSVSDLCFSCHTFAPSFHSRFTHDTTNCTTCHATIHGSNLDRIFLK